jgi:DNA-binding XRE family transcriptional regulator
MKLAPYLSECGIDRTQFAKTIGCSVEAVRLWEIGERTPRGEWMQKIMTATAGAVTPMDFLPFRPGEIEIPQAPPIVEGNNGQAIEGTAR